MQQGRKYVSEGEKRNVTATTGFSHTLGRGIQGRIPCPVSELQLPPGGGTGRRVPVVVAEPSCLKEYIQIADGLLLTGGVDIDPHCYGQSPIDPPEHYDQPRDDVELELAKEFIQLGKPILAICRGFQMINVAPGWGAAPGYSDLVRCRPQRGTQTLGGTDTGQ